MLTSVALIPREQAVKLLSGLLCVAEDAGLLGAVDVVGALLRAAAALLRPFAEGI